MSILKIARMGHPVLRDPASPVPDPQAPEIRRLIADMIETMEDAGGVGLAAPQVHVPLRLVIYKLPAARLDASDLTGEQPVTALINPVLTPMGDETVVGWEGCLSVPGLRGAVPRFNRLHVAGFDGEGRPVDKEVAGFHARVLQHECDHLDGVLYPQRMEDMRLLSFVEEAARYPVGLPQEASDDR